MKNILKTAVLGFVMITLPLAIIVGANTHAQQLDFLGAYAVTGTTSSTTYTLNGLKKAMKSNVPTCISIKRNAFINGAYKAKFGNNKAHCTTKRAKLDGVKRITANDLTTKAFIAINKAI